MKILFLISACMLQLWSGNAQDFNFEGQWVGKLKVPGVELTIVLNLTKNLDGTYNATLDSPDQGAKGIPVSEVKIEEHKMFIEIKMVGATYEATLNEDGTELTGEFKQSGMTMPLTLKKGVKVEAKRRTQQPKPPFPYKAQDVTFTNKKANVQLAGTLTIPKGKGPFPAVVLVSGSGAQDRDESLLGHKPFLVLADYLTRRGIVVLRYDDRGVGKSKGDFSKATSLDFADDTLAAIAYLKTRKEINPKRIGIAGHSEGGLIAPIAASKSRDVAFIVMMAGTGVNGEQIIYHQTALMARSAGTPESVIARNRNLQEKLFEVAKSTKSDAEKETEFEQVVEEFLASLSEAERELIGGSSAITTQAKLFTNPWFRTFMTLEPTDYIKKVRVPVLVINGSKDLQVDPKQNVPPIEKALKAGGNKQYTIKVMPGLNHLFQKAKTGSPMEYANIEETFNPAALKTIGDWILKVSGQKR
jgi:fermentation-respiration switch protein FrsA (DUF1100 family)